MIIRQADNHFITFSGKHLCQFKSQFNKGNQIVEGRVNKVYWVSLLISFPTISQFIKSCLCWTILENRKLNTFSIWNYKHNYVYTCLGFISSFSPNQNNMQQIKRQTKCKIGSLEIKVQEWLRLSWRSEGRARGDLWFQFSAGNLLFTSLDADIKWVDYSVLFVLFH